VVNHGNSRTIRRIADSSFVVAASGFAEGPAQALVQYLNRQRAARVVLVSHPLVREGPQYDEVTVFERGITRRQRQRRRVVYPPWSYPLDLVVPLSYPRCDLWFGFNGLAVARGLVERAVGRTDTVVSWHVDFVADRFGRGLLTRVFDHVDEYICKHVDLRIELSEEALRARNLRHHLGDDRATTTVVPMGAWVGQVPTTSEHSWDRRRIIFLGHLVPRQGISALLDALELLSSSGHVFSADIVGGGPLEPEVRRRAAGEALMGKVNVHGFVNEFEAVARLLSESTIAVAPYAEDADSFSRYADPGKLKSYLAAGLPIVMTAVPPNALRLARTGAATIVTGGVTGLADGILHLLGSRPDWTAARDQALLLAGEFDWGNLLDELLDRLGFTP
jgi:glycosyltransferase involved in cell wall biosynthesis